MASQGTSCRRGRSQRTYSRVNPVGFVATAESYVPAGGITGPGKPVLGAAEAHTTPATVGAAFSSRITGFAEEAYTLLRQGS